MARKQGQVIEAFKGLHFETEIRLDKNTGIFSALLPPGHEPIVDKTLDVVRVELKKFNKTYESPGGWRRMIYVKFDAPEVDGGSGSHRVARFISFSPAVMSLGFAFFEERESNPLGKRICREWRTPERIEEERERGWKVDEDRGRDEAWALDREPDGSVIIMPWTPEREAALLEIQHALGVLGNKLSTLLRRPELAAGMLPQLGSGE